MNDTFNKKSRLSLILLTSGAFFAFFVFGFADNVKGPVIPDMLLSLNLTYSQGSNILLLSYFGFMVATLIAGTLADRLGNTVVMIIAGLILAAGVGGTGFYLNVHWLYPAFFLLGFGLGTIEVAANGIIVEIYPAKNGFYLNILAFFHGAGSMAAPLFAGRLISEGGQWNSVYKLTLLLPLILTVSFIAGRFSRGKRSGDPLETASAKEGSIFRTINRELILFSILMAAYVAAEIRIASWIVEYLQKEKGLSIMTSSFYLSLYFGFITAGRLIGSTVVDLIGHIRILRIVTICSVFVLAAGLFSPPAFALILPFTGFLFSIIFPTVTASASERSSENKGLVFGILFFFAGLGGMLGPWLVGFAANIVGIRWAMTTTIVFCLIMSIVLFMIKENKGEKSI